MPSKRGTESPMNPANGAIFTISTAHQPKPGTLLFKVILRSAQPKHRFPHTKTEPESVPSPGDQHSALQTARRSVARHRRRYNLWVRSSRATFMEVSGVGCQVSGMIEACPNRALSSIIGSCSFTLLPVKFSLRSNSRTPSPVHGERVAEGRVRGQEQRSPASVGGMRSLGRTSPNVSRCPRHLKPDT